MIDPIKVLPFTDPVQNKICDHVYEKSTIEEEVKMYGFHGISFDCPGSFDFEKYKSKTFIDIILGGKKVKTQRQCWSGCINKVVNLDDLEPHRELKYEIERRKEKRQEDIATGASPKGQIFDKARRKGFAILCSNWNDTQDPYKRKEYMA